MDLPAQPFPKRGRENAGIVGGLFRDLPFQLLLNVFINVVLNRLFGRDAVNIIIALRCVVNRLVAFYIPLVVVNFVTPSVAGLNGGTSHLLTITVIVTCISSIYTTFVDVNTNCNLVPRLSVSGGITNLHRLPNIIFRLGVPRVVDIVDTLILDILINLTTA